MGELKDKIQIHNDRIKELEEEIQTYQNEVEKIKGEAQTLKGAIKSLDISSKQLGADLSLTQNKIDSTSLSIEKLGLEIGDKENSIEQNSLAMAEAIRRLNEQESNSLIETLLGNDNLSSFWGDLESLEQFQVRIKEELVALRTMKEDLTSVLDAKEKAKRELQGFKTQLADKRRLVEENKKEKNTLLSITKNKESTYQDILTDKVKQKEAFERELLQFETQLKIAIDPSSFPTAGTNIFIWPLDRIKVTQLFGGTEFAQTNPGVYGRPFHNGTDFAAPVGTTVKAALSGVVKGTGNTDSVKGCYSYGKWILVEHFNGLSTLYAHLSLIKVGEGDKVTTSDILGYTGNTGYSTGPHLHFAVYASKGVQIVKLGDVKSKTNCATVPIPVASLNAYLDPLSYLPPLNLAAH